MKSISSHLARTQAVRKTFKKEKYCTNGITHHHQRKSKNNNKFLLKFIIVMKIAFTSTSLLNLL